MSLKVAEFGCNFCGESFSDLGWCKVRLMQGEKTSNTMFEKEWVNDPLMNCQGSHICVKCAEELAEAIK